MKKTEFELIQFSDPRLFKEEIEKKLDNDWIFHGQPMVVSVASEFLDGNEISTRATIWYIQAMTKTRNV